MVFLTTPFVQLGQGINNPYMGRNILPSDNVYTDMTFPPKTRLLKRKMGKLFIFDTHTQLAEYILAKPNSGNIRG